MSTRLENDKIRSEALRLGFSVCGIAKAEAVEPLQADAFRQWLEQHKQADMNYMANHIEKRLDPTLLMEGAESVICVALNYYPTRLIPDNQLHLARYAYGKDYHDVVKARLRLLEEFIVHTTPDATLTRCFCDTAPMLEKYWAWKAGLGWIGKHTQLVVPEGGTHFFLGEILVNCAADRYDIPQPERCGNCTRCIDACPNAALEAPYKLDARRCLSYLTIEHRGDMNPAEALKMGSCFYGCDECQKACPWNRFAEPSEVEEFAASQLLLSMEDSDWLQLSEEQYRTLFKGSAVKRAKFSGLKRNIEAVRQARATSKPQSAEKSAQGESPATTQA